jgi:hypothetical protein
LLRAETRGTLRANWRRLGVVCVGRLALAVVVTLATKAFGSSDYVAGFSIGLMVGVLPLFWQSY